MLATRLKHVILSPSADPSSGRIADPSADGKNLHFLDIRNYCRCFSRSERDQHDSLAPICVTCFGHATRAHASVVSIPCPGRNREVAELPREDVVVQFEIYNAESEVGLAVDMPAVASKSESGLWSNRPFILYLVSDRYAIAQAFAPSTSAISLAVRPYRSYTSRSASSLQHVVKGQVGVPHNLVEDSFPQIAFAVDRDSRPAAVGMNEHGMASRLAVQGKAAPL